VGPALNGDAPGGMATVSRTLVKLFDLVPSVHVRPITNFDEGSTLRRLFVALRAILEIAKSRSEIDVVHVQVAIGLSIQRDLLLALFNKLFGIPTIAQYHGAGQIDDYNEGSSFHRFCYRSLMKLCLNVALGPKSFDWLHDVLPTVNAVILPNSVDVPESAAPFTGGRPKFVFVGRLGERKGIYDLLLALETFPSEGSDIELLVLGDGEVAAVRELVQNKAILRGRVAVLGWQSEDAVKRVIRESWALILPSYAEGLPLAILEAMAMGRTIIGSRVGEIESVVIPGETGILVNPGDIPGIVDGIKTLAESPEFTKELGLNAHEFAKTHLSNERMIMQLANIYASQAGTMTEQLSHAK
jgi:glycosyltransferase involved in cell wall biosynthesis